MEVEVILGNIRISTIDLVVDEPHCKIFHIECHTKYPEVLSAGIEDEDSIGVILIRGPHTIRFDPNHVVGTKILFKGVPNLGSWTTITPMNGRYTIPVVIYNPEYPINPLYKVDSSDD